MAVESRLLNICAELESGLRTGGLHLLEQATFNPDLFRDALDAKEFEQLGRRMSHRALLFQLDAVSRSVLEILDTALVDQGVDDFLRPVADEMHGRGEFPYLRVMRALLDPDGDVRAVVDVAQRVPQQLPLGCGHDASPLNVHRALYTMLDNILGENGGGGFSSAPTNNTENNGREVA